MAAIVMMGLLLLSSFASHSDANYCTCNSGVGDSVLQKNIDYACGNGADCSAIQQNGPCFNPNTVKDHCNYAVNSYYQRKQQTAQSCDFQATAMVTPNPPSSNSGCVFQSGQSGGGGGTVTPTPTNPSLSPPVTGGGTPVVGGTPNTGGSGTPATIPGTTVSPPGFGGGITPPAGIGLAPGGGGFGTTDGTGSSVGLLPPRSTVGFVLGTLLFFALVI